MLIKTRIPECHDQIIEDNPTRIAAKDHISYLKRVLYENNRLVDLELD